MDAVILNEKFSCFYSFLTTFFYFFYFLTNLVEISKDVLPEALGW